MSVSLTGCCFVDPPAHVGVCQLSHREPNVRLTDEGEHDAAGEELRLQVPAAREVHPPGVA